MRYSGKALVIFCLWVMAIWVIISALKWPPKTALFPLIIGIAVFLMALAELLFTLFGKEEGGEETVMDFQLSRDTDPALATRRTISISIWILGFLLMILLLGFPVTAPLCIFLYLKLEGKERWGISLGVAAGVGACFYFLFIWLLNTSFEEGWVIEGLKKGLKF